MSSGTLAFFILMSAMLTRGNLVPTTLEETTSIATTIEEVGEIPSFKIRDLPFSTFVLNPCVSGISRNGERNRTRTEIHVYATAFYRYMSNYGTQYKQDAQKVINESTVGDCTLLNLRSLPSTPSLLELTEMDGESVLRKLSYSLLFHSAYAYFVNQQYDPSSNISSSPCSQEGADRERNLGREAVILARKLKHMACMVEMTIEELGYSPEDISSLLEEGIRDLRMCSRRAVRDCQVMSSVFKLFDVIARYSAYWLETATAN